MTVVRDRTLPLGAAASLVFEEGVVVPRVRGENRCGEFLFIGRGRLRVAPEDPIEADQLDLFTGHRRLDTAFSNAVFQVGSAEWVELLTGGGVPPESPPPKSKFKSLAETWKASRERVEIGRLPLLRSCVGEQVYAHSFGARLELEKLGTVVITFDPSREEPLELGQWVREDVSFKEKMLLRRAMAHVRGWDYRDQVNLGEWGTWNTWVSLPATTEIPPPDAPGDVEPTSYRIDATIDPDHETTEGTCHIDLVTMRENTRSLLLRMARSGRVLEIRDGQGRKLAFSRGGGAALVLLPEPLPAKQAFGLDIDFRSATPTKVRRDVFTVDAGSSRYWYPHAGSRDRAYSEMTLHWPSKYQLIASGEPLEEDVEGKLRWRRYRMAAPTSGVSWRIGRFTRYLRQVGDIKLTVAFSSAIVKDDTVAKMEKYADDVEEALTFLQDLLGPLPLEHLTVVTTEDFYSQGVLGFITFTERERGSRSLGHGKMQLSDARAVLAHELAHQWFPYMIGARTYHDEWLSEGMAQYAAYLYVRDHLKLERVAGGASLTPEWRERFDDRAGQGRFVHDIGPITLGYRLDSTMCADCGTLYLYEKAPLAIDLLAQRLGEKKFWLMLRHLLRKAKGKALDTGAFFIALGRMSAQDLSGFADTFFYGTAIPVIGYRYEIEPLDKGKWKVWIKLRRRPDEDLTFKVVRLDNGRLDTRCVLESHDPLRDLPLRIPIRIDLRGEDKGLSKSEKELQDLLADLSVRAEIKSGSQRFLRGLLWLTGDEKEVTQIVEEEPVGVDLDKAEQVLAWFRTDEADEKHRLAAEAKRARRLGESARALELADGALAAPGEEMEQDEIERLDAWIRLNKALALLDLGRLDEAEESIRDARRVLGGEKWLVTALEARLDLARGDAKQAYRLLWKDVLNGKNNLIDAHLLLGIAAVEQGEWRTVEKVIDLGHDVRADVHLLEEALAEQGQATGH